MYKRIFFLVFIFAICVGGYFLWKKITTVSVSSDINRGKIHIVTTFYPLEAFARAVGGDAAVVTSIVPAGTEPHDYEPTPQNILAVYQADVFLLNGAGIDMWAEKIRPELEKRGVIVLQMSDIVSVLTEMQGGNIVSDPHFWLDPLLAQKEIENIRDALVRRDPIHGEVYTQNAKQYSEELRNLDTVYRSGLGRCSLHTIVTSHDAFAYLAKRYGFTAIAVSGLSPEAEPSPRRLTEIAQTVRSQNLKFIFFETLVSPKIAETLAQATGVQTLVFDPLEGLTDMRRQSGADYLSIMRENLNNLQKALECQK